MSDTEEVVALKDVRKHYSAGGLFRGRHRIDAVRGVSLRLRRGECLALVGESGCGKSTLASILLGLERPSAGEVRIHGRSLVAMSRRERAKAVRIVFQDPYSSLNPRQTIRQIVELPLRIHERMDGSERARTVRRIVERVGLSETLLEKYPAELSGGQRQRVAIARALVDVPEIVVCDEPTSALDVSIQAQIINLLKELQQELGLTYLFISHDLGVVSHIADRVAIMLAGEIVEEGPVERIFETPLHPYTRLLLGSVLSIDAAAGQLDASDPVDAAGPPVPATGCSFAPRCPHVFERCSAAVPLFEIDERRVRCRLYAEDDEGRRDLDPLPNGRGSGGGGGDREMNPHG